MSNPKPMVKWDVHLNRTAVIVVDMMNEFCVPGGPLYVPQTAGIIQNIKTLLGVARRVGLPVIYLRHMVRGDGSDVGRLADIHPAIREGKIIREGSPGVEIVEDLAPQPGDILIKKRMYSGFHNTELDSILRSRDIDTLILCGTLTNVCCETTARDAIHREYKVIFLSDANATMDWPDMGWGPVSAELAQRVTLTALAFAFCQVSPTKETIEQIQMKAG